MDIIKQDDEFVYVKQTIIKIIKKRKRYIDPDGYVRVFVGYDYEGSFRGYMREHIYNMEKYLHRQLKKYEKVHHKDGNKQNNKIENLEILSDRQHGWYHHPRWLIKFKDVIPP